MGPAVTIVEHKFPDRFTMLAMQLSSGTLERTGIKMPKLFYRPVRINERDDIFRENFNIQFVTYSSDAVITVNVLFFLNSCIRVIEQFRVGLSQDSFAH